MATSARRPSVTRSMAAAMGVRPVAGGSTIVRCLSRKKSGSPSHLASQSVLRKNRSGNKRNAAPSSRRAALRGREYRQSFLFARRSGLGPVASRCDFTSDRIQAGQSKRTFIRRRFSSVHFNENLAAIRHRAQEPNDVPLKGEASPRLRGSPALFNRRLFVDPVYDLHLTIRGLFPGARRGNDQLCALGATMNGERGRGVLRRRRARRRQRSDLRLVVNRRSRLADNPVRAWWLHSVRCCLLQEFVDALQPLHAFIF